MGRSATSNVSATFPSMTTFVVYEKSKESHRDAPRQDLPRSCKRRKETYR